ncbi:DegT/DnrJ/EryC1/StrS family aminotransferase [Paucisalibacillus globulus]|uniref:DegT/DnrJ/EryC1/StrS family aminotransferase n=1 Tax=Paucisalibacillus globulus TaxID=351095 RepID=UPI00040BB464|nr:DegT/DnrJ/EryC1/StrS family aminotransferase [Paucisalibacillus globulus]
MIPLIDLTKQYGGIQKEIIEAIQDVLTGGQYILGPKVKELEEKISERLGVRHAIAVGNGTDALVLTLDAYGIGSGDEVITTPFTFFATAEAISKVGATPVFVDIDPDTFHMDPSKLADKLSTRTKAILPVHIFGQPASMDTILAFAAEHDLLVIEDACQAFGATFMETEVGSIGDAACFSFFPTKNLGTIGDGGLITTSDDRLAESLRKLRVHGSQEKYFHQQIGYNSRLDEIHAAILLICLREIDTWNEQRISIANYYFAKLNHVKHIELPVVMSNRSHVFHLFCIKSSRRKEIISALKQADIQTGIYYPQCLHLQEVYRELGYDDGDFPVAEMAASQLFAIPMHPFLSREDQDRVIDVIQKVSERL